MCLTNELSQPLASDDLVIAERFAQEYPGQEITLTEVFEYIMRHNILNSDQLYAIDHYIQRLGLELPQMDVAIDVPKLELDVKTFLKQVIMVSNHHAQLAFIATKLALNWSDEKLFKTTYNDLATLPTTLPEWLTDILNFQRHLVYCQGLSDSSRLFFIRSDRVLSYIAMRKAIQEARRKYKLAHGHELNDYIKQYHKFGTHNFIITKIRRVKK